MSKRGEKIFKYVSAVIALFVLVYLSYQVYTANYSSVKTETALMKTVEDTIDTTAFIVRDESYVTTDVSGTVVPMTQDGQRVAQGENIAAVFSDEAAAENYMKMQELEEEIARYNNLSAAETLDIKDINNYDEHLNAIFTNMISNIEAGDFEEVDELSKTVLSKITSRQIALGVDVDYGKALNDLQARLHEIPAVTPRYITSQTTGYYINYVDGYENALSYEDVTKLSTYQISSAINREKDEVADNVIGKLVNSFNWYLVCCVQRKDVAGLVDGSSVTVRFTDAAASDVTASVVSIKAESEDEVALVLKCNAMNDNTANLRIEKVQIIKKTIEGYRVDKDAIHSLDGMNGVYIRRGNIISFRRITILSSNEDYVIVRTYEDEYKTINESANDISEEELNDKKEAYVRRREETQRIMDLETNYSRSAALSKNYIKLYDEVIVKGKDLYDDKLL